MRWQPVSRACPAGHDARGGQHLSFHFLLSSRPALFSNCEQLRMQPPWLTSTGGAPARSPEVHWMYRSLRAQLGWLAGTGAAQGGENAPGTGLSRLHACLSSCHAGRRAPVVATQEVTHQAVAVHLAQRRPAQGQDGVRTPRALHTSASWGTAGSQWPALTLHTLDPARLPGPAGSSAGRPQCMTRHREVLSQGHLGAPGPPQLGGVGAGEGLARSRRLAARALRPRAGRVCLCLRAPALGALHACLG